MTLHDRTLPSRGALVRAAALGVVASTAYLAEQALDRAVTRNEYDDLLLWGGVVTKEPRRARLVGALTHYSLGTALALTYVMLAPRMPRLPGWLRGALFVQAENTLLFPAVAVIDRVHPAVRRGDLPRLWTWRYFWIEAVRHLAFGLVLGMLDSAGDER